jgi:hypothetical protein
VLKSFIYDKPRWQIEMFQQLTLFRLKRCALTALLWFGAVVLFFAAGGRVSPTRSVVSALPIVFPVAALSWVTVLIAPSPVIVELSRASSSRPALPSRDGLAVASPVLRDNALRASAGLRPVTTVRVLKHEQQEENQDASSAALGQAEGPRKSANSGVTSVMKRYRRFDAKFMAAAGEGRCPCRYALARTSSQHKSWIERLHA